MVFLSKKRAKKRQILQRGGNILLGARGEVNQDIGVFLAFEGFLSEDKKKKQKNVKKSEKN